MLVIDKNYKSMGLPMNIKRGNPWPLDVSSLWYSYEDMKAYAEDASGVAYVGQILALVDETKNSAEAYIIADTNGTLKPVGAGPLVDNKTIEIDSESESIALKDFGKRYYRYIPEVTDEAGEVLAEASYELVEVSAAYPWKAGLELRVASENGEFVLGWYEPNPTTIEGVNNQIAGIQTTVTDLQQVVTGLQSSVGSPASEGIEASGIYAAIEEKANAADVYTKEETNLQITTLISQADHLQRKIVTSYTAIQEFINEKGKEEAAKYIFMVPETDTTADGNLYEEYIVIDGVIEVVGKWATDLSGYVTSESLEETLESYVTSNSLATTLEGYATDAELQGVSNALSGLEVVVAGKVDADENARLITLAEAEKLDKVNENAEENYIKAVTEAFTVAQETGTLSLNLESLDLTTNTKFSELSSALSALSVTVGTHTGNIDALEQSIETNNSAIEALQTAQKTMQEAVAANKKGVEDLNTSFSSLSDELNAAKQDIADNASAIDALEVQLNSYVLKDTYDKDIAELKDILTWKPIGESAE